MMRDFTAVPNALIRGEVRHADGRRLSFTAQALYALILDYSRCGDRTCTASQQTLGARLGLTSRAVRTGLRELEQLGLVSCQRKGRAGTNTIVPLLLPEGKSASDHNRTHTSDKEDAQGEEDNVSTKGDTGVVPLRRSES